MKPLLAVLLVAAAGLVTYGIWQMFEPAAWIAAGVFVAVIAVLFLAEVA